MKIKPLAMALVILLVIFGGIGATMAMGVWSTTSNKVPAKFKDGANAGEANPADIRGSYTFTDIASSFKVDATALLAAFGFPADKDPAQTKAKDLEARYAGLAHEIGTGSIRLFVALYKNLPIDLDDTYLPMPAVPIILAANPNLTAEQRAHLESHQVDLGPAAVGPKGTQAQTPNPSAANPAAANPSAVSSYASTASTAISETNSTAAAGTQKAPAATEPVVNGQATFQQLLDAGITRAQIEQVLGAPLPPTNQSVRDYCTSKGMSFSTVKNALNALVPAK